jgi:hypothetical protein
MIPPAARTAGWWNASPFTPFRAGSASDTLEENAVGLPAELGEKGGRRARRV